MATTQILSRVLDRLLTYREGRQAFEEVQREDLEARGAYVREITDAERWRSVELDRLGALRRDAEATVTALKAQLREAEQGLRELDRGIAWTRSEADRRIGIAERALRESASPSIAALVGALIDIENSIRGQFSAVVRHVTRGFARERRVVDSNGDQIAAVLAVVREVRARVEALRLVAMSEGDLGERLLEAQREVEHAIVEHGLRVEWRWPA